MFGPIICGGKKMLETLVILGRVCRESVFDWMATIGYQDGKKSGKTWSLNKMVDKNDWVWKKEAQIWFFYHFCYMIFDYYQWLGTWSQSFIKKSII